MRAAFALVAAALMAAPAAAQTLPSPLLRSQNLQTQMQLNLLQADLMAQQQLAQQRQISQQNELMATDARLRAQQAEADIRATNRSIKLAPQTPALAPPTLDASQFASMPDDELAASTRRAEAAAQNQR